MPEPLCTPELETLRARLALSPQDRGLRLELAMALNNLAVREGLARLRHAEALPLLEEGLALLRPLAEAAPADDELLDTLLFLLDHAGQCQAALRDLEAVRAVYAELLARFRARVARRPEEAVRLSSWLDTAGDRFWPLGALAEARAHYEEGYALAERLARASPGDDGARLRLSVATGHLRQLAELEGRPEEVLRWDDAALALARAEPGVEAEPGRAQTLCVALGAAATRAVGLGLLGRARGLVDEQLARAEAGLARWPGTPGLLSERAEALKNLAGLAQREGDPAGTRARFEAHLEALRALVERDPSSLNLERLSTSLGELVELLPEGDDAVLGPALEAWLAVIRRRLPVTPFPTEARLELAKALAQQAALRQRAGQAQAAWDTYQEALQAQLGAIRERPGDAQARLGLAVLLWNSQHLLPEGSKRPQLELLLQVLEPFPEGEVADADLLRRLGREALGRLG